MGTVHFVSECRPNLRVEKVVKFESGISLVDLFFVLLFFQLI